MPYSDGDLVAVPLRDSSGYAVGLIAAHDGGGAVVGYFFGTLFTDFPTLGEASKLGHRDVLRVMRFGDLGLVSGDWRSLGRHESWVASEWPLPTFGRRDMSGSSFRVVYCAEDLTGPAREEPIDDEECDLLPRDSLSGSGAVERVLTHLIGSTS